MDKIKPNVLSGVLMCASPSSNLCSNNGLTGMGKYFEEILKDIELPLTDVKIHKQKGEYQYVFTQHTLGQCKVGAAYIMSVKL